MNQESQLLLLAESQLLGALLCDNVGLDFVADHVEPEDFWDRRNASVFQAIIALVSGLQHANSDSVVQYLQGIDKLEEAGGVEYINALPQFVLTVSNLRRLASIVHNASIGRRSIDGDPDVIQNFFTANPKVTSEESVTAEDLKLDEVNTSGVCDNTKFLASYVVDYIEHLQQSQGAFINPVRSKTDLAEYAKYFDDLRPGELVVTSGRSLTWIASLASSIATQAAGLEKLPVLIFSLELAAYQVTRRLINSIGDVAESKVNQHTLDDSAWLRLAKAVDTVGKATVLVHDTGIRNVEVARSVARRAKRRVGQLGLIVFDYIGLVRSVSDAVGHDEKYEQEVAKAVCGLKLMAKEVQCPVVAISQARSDIAHAE